VEELRLLVWVQLVRAALPRLESRAWLLAL
jgi:hypothetical protein